MTQFEQPTRIGSMPGFLAGCRAGRQGAVAALALALALLGGCAKPPEVRFADGSGGSWDQWNGRWVLINYWAEWCAPCREEIPELNRLQRNGEAMDLVVMGVNFDGLQGEPLSTLIDRMDIQFPVLLDDPRGRWSQELPSVLPSTLVIDPDGNLHGVLVGPQTYESLSSAVQASMSL